MIAARDRYKELFEKKHGIRLGFMGFFAKAACLALKDVPAVNAQIEGEEIVYHDYVDISVAVSAPNGLVVPVVRDADNACPSPASRRPSPTMASAPSDGTLTMEDMKGGTFTISNGGVFGSADVDPDHQPAAVGGARPAPDRGPPGGARRPDRDPADDVHRPEL